MAARLKAAGFTDGQLTLFATPEHPKEGGLVAVYPGTSTTAKPLLLIAHIDVVEARREDWERDPFTLIEENGYFYARGIVRHEGAGRRLGRRADPLQAAGLRAEAHDQDGADLRRGDQRRVQRHRMAGREPARADRRRVRPQRRRWRRQRRQGEGDRPVGADRRKDLRQFPGGNAQPRRPQFRAGARQRHLPAVAGAAQDRRARVPAGNDRHDAALLQGGRRRPERRHRQGHGRAGREPAGPEGRGDRQHGPLPPFQPAHDLRGDAAGRRPRAPTRCRSVPAPTSTAGSFPAIRSRRSGASWPR